MSKEQKILWIITIISDILIVPAAYLFSGWGLVVSSLVTVCFGIAANIKN